jgi:hypothetical protein
VADERWRALERRWQQTGAVEDEAALLTERVRAGDLAQARAALAAWLGHEAAVPSAGPGFDTIALVDLALHAEGQHAFWSGVLAFGTEVAARSLLAFARHHRQRIDEGVRLMRGHDERVVVAWGRAASQCVDSGVSWVLSPTDEARAVLIADAERVSRTVVPRWPARVARSVAASAIGELATAVHRLAELAQGRPVASWISDPTDFVAARAALRAEVVPWALGRADPLREEVDRRLADVSNIRIASPCHVTWNSMRERDGDPRVRHCDRCDQPVFDLNRLPLAEAEAIVRAREQGQRLCVRLYRRTDGSVLLRDCPVGLDDRVAPDRDFIG